MSAEDPHIERDASGRDDPAVLLSDALERSRQHARAALSEALACLGALLDAASLATSGVPAEAHGLLSQLTVALTEASRGLAPEAGGSEIVDALAQALDQEIERWELRAADDPDARAVLRAFLGIRELLWELGVRRREAAREGGLSVVPPRERVQRVHVQGA